MLLDGLGRMKSLKLLELPGMDQSKILVSVQVTGIRGHELDEILRREFHIELEMACSSYVCAITSVGDTKEGFKRLLDAFTAVDKRLSEKQSPGGKNIQTGRIQGTDEVIPTESICTLLETEKMEKEKCLLEDACGRISGDFVTLYPPGIPILAPGERITEKIVERLFQYLREGLELHGIEEAMVQVLKRRTNG